MSTTDLLIIGGGPVGLYAATLASLHGLRVTLVEALSRLGGQLTAIYPEKKIYDVAGFREVRAEALANELIEQALAYRPQVFVGETAVHIHRREDGVLDVVTDQRTHSARTVLVTAGIGAPTPRPIPAANADRLVGRGVFYVLPHLETFRGMRVAVVGGGDTAVDAVLELASVAQRVYLIHRRKEFRAQRGALERISRLAHVTVMTPAEVRRVEGNDCVEAILVERTDRKVLELLPIDALVSGLGFVMNLGPLKSWPLTWEGSRIKVRPDTMETSLPGVLAAGDVVSYPGKVYLIATGFGEVGIAVARIRQILQPERTGTLPHSTMLVNAYE